MGLVRFWSTVCSSCVYHAFAMFQLSMPVAMIWWPATATTQPNSNNVFFGSFCASYWQLEIVAATTLPRKVAKGQQLSTIVLFFGGRISHDFSSKQVVWRHVAQQRWHNIILLFLHLYIGFTFLASKMASTLSLSSLTVAPAATIQKGPHSDVSTECPSSNESEMEEEPTFNPMKFLQNRILSYQPCHCMLLHPIQPTLWACHMPNNWLN